jgi:trehalose 6-phosphate synthase
MRTDWHSLGAMPVAGPAEVLIASNRGPVSFAINEQGALSLRRGGGGLVSGLSAVAGETGETGLWICTALTDADRTATRRAGGGRLDEAGHDTGGAAVRMLDIDATTFNRAYNAVANSVLWFVHHLLYDIPTVPHFDASFRRDWDSYVAYNAAFADAIATDAAPGATVLVQDYHLTLVPRLLRERRPDLRVGHFSHTPWAPADYFDLLPDEVAREVLLGVLGADRAAFLTIRWARAFLACCARVLHLDVDYQALTVAHDGRVTAVGVHALGVDGDYLRARSRQPDVEAKRATLLETVGACRVVLRVDRTELSKNIVRGLAAYRELLRTRPEWRGKVVHVAFAYPSRHDLPEYREYTAAVQRIAAEIEDEFGTADWRPLVLAVDDDFARSLAAYRIADVLVVNPIRDGMNLVAKEVPVVSERGVALVLSREAGAVHELGGDAAVVNPYDVSETAAALHQALTMPETERAARTRRLAAAATALPPRRWFADQLAALSD